MVTKRVRSEYMKKFKDPKWETYTKCYEEMLAYRLTRRLLEHTHNPWFWSGSDSDSEAGGRTPTSPSKYQVGTETSRDRAEPELEELENGRRNTQQDLHTTTTEAVVPRLPILNEEENGPAQSAAHVLHSGGTRNSKVLQGEEEEQTVCSRASKQSTRPLRDRDAGGPRSQKTKLFKSAKQTRRSQQVRPAPLQQPREDTKESRHPFALYGSGEKDADISGRKTHNVGPAASTSEIHESALRAKTRREVERQVQAQRSERRRAKSVDLNKARKLVQPEFNPWLTEYMRCFSARTR